MMSWFTGCRKERIANTRHIESLIKDVEWWKQRWSDEFDEKWKLKQDIDSFIPIFEKRLEVLEEKYNKIVCAGCGLVIDGTL